MQEYDFSHDAPTLPVFCRGVTLSSFYHLPVKFPPRVHRRATGLCLPRERHGLSMDWLLEFFGF